MLNYSFSFKTTLSPIDYAHAINYMENYVETIINNTNPQLIWLLEHFDVYTAGSSSVPIELINNNNNIPVIKTNRGGKYTYHGIGQRIIYLMLDLNRRNRDIKTFIHNLELLVIKALQDFTIKAYTKENQIGVWVQHRGIDKKIAAIGIRVKKWITYHGVALNIQPNLTHFSGIIPCGNIETGVTSIYELGKSVSYQELDIALKKHCISIFGEH